MSAVVLAVDPDSHLLALYLDGTLVWDFGPHDPCHGPLGGPTYLDDALEALFERMGADFETRSCHPVATKTWTDSGWEWDAEWPQRLEDAVPASEAFDMLGAEEVAPMRQGSGQ